MKVFVAEKPKLGKAIAAQLMKMSPVVESEREFIAGKDWVVCWASGHIFEQEDPDFYIGRKYPGARKNGEGRFVWTFDHLPLVPESNGWAIHVVADKSRLFSTIKKFVGKATVVVNAGDPDREGQLLIDEILEEIGNEKPVRRVLIPAFDEVTVTNGLKNERDNAEFRGMHDAALARSRADWLCGMNFSRAVTLQAQASGYPKSISIGRVQTPLLGLIVQRYLEIESFKPVDYFTVVAKMKVEKGEFLARWKPNEGQAGLDEEGRLMDRRVADQLNTLVTGKVGKVVEYSDEEKHEGPPLPFSVGRLQITMSKQYGYNSADILKAAQSLYDQKLTTYPRSDCQYLPVSQMTDAPMVLAAVRNSLSFDEAVLSQIDPTRKSRAWNDSKVSAHHAIIPTTEKANLSSLSTIERHVYEAICKRYVAQFMPNRRYRAVAATIDVCGQRFQATGNTTIHPGWKALYGETQEAEDDAKKDEDSAVLPPMKQGDSANCLGLNVAAKKTAPPKLFTESTLLEAMINIHKFVTDEKIKGIFMKMRADKVGDDEGGLGTPATRHTFVPKLIEIGVVICVESEGKGGKKAKEPFYKPTDAGVALIRALPSELGRPDMTALWEASMDEIEAGRATVDRFLEMQASYIGKTIDKIRAVPLTLPDPPGAKKKSFGGGNGAPRKPAEPAGKDCPKCGKPMMKRGSTKGPFLGCSNYPECKHTENIN